MVSQYCCLVMNLHIITYDCLFLFIFKCWQTRYPTWVLGITPRHVIIAHHRVQILFDYLLCDAVYVYTNRTKCRNLTPSLRPYCLHFPLLSIEKMKVGQFQVQTGHLPLPLSINWLTFSFWWLGRAWRTDGMEECLFRLTHFSEVVWDKIQTYFRISLARDKNKWENEASC